METGGRVPGRTSPGFHCSGNTTVTSDPSRQGGLGSLAVCVFRDRGPSWWAPRLGVHPPVALTRVGSSGVWMGFSSAGPCLQKYPTQYKSLSHVFPLFFQAQFFSLFTSFPSYVCIIHSFISVTCLYSLLLLNTVIFALPRGMFITVI